MLKISDLNTLYFLRYVKSLFTNIQKQQKLLKISLLFRKFYKLQGQVTREFLGLRMQSFQGIVFYMSTNTQENFQIFKPQDLPQIIVISTVFGSIRNIEENISDQKRIILQNLKIRENYKNSKTIGKVCEEYYFQ